MSSAGSRSGPSATAIVALIAACTATLVAVSLTRTVDRLEQRVAELEAGR